MGGQLRGPGIQAHAFDGGVLPLGLGAGSQEPEGGAKVGPGGVLPLGGALVGAGVAAETVHGRASAGLVAGLVGEGGRGERGAAVALPAGRDRL